ncbi:ferritin-like domain-containing protein [Mucilaginibacter sp.]|uniref:ferritin-like domain-containing protein n=1 Tax=Mucilaginibacter sp. TaxID=1882438 RepID=UPI00284AD169|nr:ferritin-like domain-containing protein [Mucilaginibacter sp.]MDR3695830.1 ferritin-like domain-containing protein [Mucilaginibacter sp.]
MKTTNQWITHFNENALQKRVNWDTKPHINQKELRKILPSMQAWQLGETSEGTHLIAASQKYALKIGDPQYLMAVKLFIKEEQKHGNNLGKYLDKIGEPRIKQNWGDTLFRKIRYFNTNMELWTLAVLVVESTAQLFYQSLKNATCCKLLKEICTDILIDEAQHIHFQTERLTILYENKSPFSKRWRQPAYKLFFFLVSQLVWFAHSKLFKAGGLSYKKYNFKMVYKYNKTIKGIIKAPFIWQNPQVNLNYEY